MHKSLGKLLGTKPAMLVSMTNRRSEAPTLRNIKARRSQMPTLPAIKAYTAKGYHYVSYTGSDGVMVFAVGPYETYAEAMNNLEFVRTFVMTNVDGFAAKFEVFCSETFAGMGFYDAEIRGDV